MAANLMIAVEDVRDLMDRISDTIKGEENGTVAAACGSLMVLAMADDSRTRDATLRLYDESIAALRDWLVSLLDAK